MNTCLKLEVLTVIVVIFGIVGICALSVSDNDNKLPDEIMNITIIPVGGRICTIDLPQNGGEYFVTVDTFTKEGYLDVYYAYEINEKIHTRFGYEDNFISNRDHLGYVDKFTKVEKSISIPVDAIEPRIYIKSYSVMEPYSLSVKNCDVIQKNK